MVAWFLGLATFQMPSSIYKAANVSHPIHPCKQTKPPLSVKNAKQTGSFFAGLKEPKFIRVFSLSALILVAVAVILTAIVLLSVFGAGQELI